MKFRIQILALLLASCSTALAQETIADVIADRTLDLSRPTDRAKAVKRMKEIEDKNLDKAKQIANRRGMPLRQDLPNGRSRVLVGVNDDGELLYYEDRNSNAAISTAANKLHTSPYSINGSGVRVGVWENSSPRSSHQEFNDGPASRINLVQTTTFGNHATHVAGTIGAFGVEPSAKGMAYQTTVDAYTTGSDTSEMTAAGATGPGQHATKLYVSNHSYGYTYGWTYPDGQPVTWNGTGTDQNGYDPDFGKYNGTSRSFDLIHYNTPYYLAFWAAGNENTDGPSNGQSCVIGGSTVSYNPAIHPQNDGLYSGGFDTLGDHTTAKNVMVIGAANDAVTGGQRDPSKATIAGFSSTGPCDDGRIKPDVVGNGLSVYSSISTSDTSYASYQGTSMSTPNVCGTAALLVDLHRSLNSGGAMRASTLRGLLIHTATDIGRPGPDYTFGWGLADGEKAAQLIKRQADYPDLKAIMEDQVTPSEPVKTVTFSWDGTSPIRATLAWTDPAGVADSGHNDRTPDLVNDLNLKLIAPNGAEYFPFVMPFVGTWTIASMSANATTGVNHVDNVEQVLINSPGQPGAWQAQVSYVGALTNNVQQYGLLISGSDSVGALAFSPASYVVNENAGTATISVSRVGGSTGAVSVNYATSNGTAFAGSDYTATSGTLSWNNGESGSKTISIPILNDGTSETYDETVQVTLSSPIGITISGTNPAVVTILDDEPLMGVTSFNNGGTFASNTQQNITWSSSLGGNVRIELLKNGINYTTIASSTPNDGLFSWTIPLLVPTGSDYSIRVTRLAGGGESDVSDGTFAILNQASGTIYAADMSTNPGWTLQGDWAYGVPAGNNGDPSSGKTGGNVIGYNLNGLYPDNLPETYATTTAIDCSGYTNVQLSFQRWLRIEASQYDKASIQASNNGTAWTTIWAHSGSNLLDTSWKSMTYDISAVADGQPVVYIRWVMGTTDNSVNYGGWNIDDVVVSGLSDAVNPAGEVEFSAASYQVSENAGTATITVNRTLGTSGAISVDYSTANATASAGSDYTATSGTLNWANGDGAAKTIVIPIANDSTREDFLETLTISLTNTVGGTIVGTNPSTLTIQDDDNNAPDVNAGDDQFAVLQPVSLTPGLYYGTVAGNIDTTTPNPNKTVLTNVASQTENAIAGNTTEIYTGSIYDADGQISFTEHIDDKARIWIDGVLVLSNDAWNVRSSTANLNISPGWHDIEIRISNGSGGSGPVASPGIGYDPAGGTAWQTLVDPGDGSLLRTEQAVPSVLVDLDGIASDLDSDELTTIWSRVSGPAAVTFGDASSLVTTATFTQEGVYTLRLTADDGRDSSSDDVVITVGSSGLALNIESVSMAENGGTSNATVTRPGTFGNLVVTLTSSDTSEATVPTSVTIPDGQTSASFTVTAQDDGLVDGTQTVTITATSAGNPDATDIIDVTDNEVATLTLNIAAASVSESGGAAATTAMVTRNSVATGEMVVNLSSSDTSEATVPSTITIAAGQTTSSAFNIAAVDDSIVDGTQMVTITASFAGHSNGTDTLDVTDDPSINLTVVPGTGGASTTGGGTFDPDAGPFAITATPFPGYNFENWTVTSGAGSVDNPNSANTFVTAASSATVQANFQIITYTVGYNGNANTGGSAPDNQTKTHGVDLTLMGPGDLVKTGHTFSGWNTQADGSGTSYPAGGTYTANANATLHAQWTPDAYAVTYDGNGNTGGAAPANQDKLHDIELTLRANTGNLTRTGYSFRGWNTAPDGNGTDYPESGTYTDNAPLALYAKWSLGTDLHWSGDGSTLGGAGSWDTTNARWGAGATGPFPTVWKSGNSLDRAVFGGTAGTVTLSTEVMAGGITFNTAGYSITGSKLTLASGTIIHSTVGTSISDDPVIASELAGTTGFTKTGGGWLGIEGTTSSLSGNVNIQEGTLYARFSSLGSANLVFAGNSNFTKVYDTTATTATGFTVNEGVTATIGGSTFYYNFTTTGALVGNSSAKLFISSGSNTEKNFNSTSNTFAGEITLGGGGTADNGQRAGFRSLGDSNQKIIINDALFRLNNGGVSMDFANRQLEMTNNARLDNDSTNPAVIMGFAQDLSVKTGSNSRVFSLTGVNTGNNSFSGVIANSSTGTGATQVRKQETGTWKLGSNNTYTGKTTVDSGTLVVDSLKNLDTASSIGRNNILQLGYFNSSGTLRYMGGGDTTNRPIQINDYTSGTGNTGSAIILNSGSGALTFTATEFIPSNETVVANRALELGGDYTGAANTIQGTIQDIAPVAGKAIISVVKRNDASTWTFTGTNSYKGTTTVSGGKLFINGNQSTATGAVSVAANATLGGTGILGGNTTIAANGRLEFNISTPAGSHDKLELASGKSLSFSGASVLTITSTGGNPAPGQYVLLTAPGDITGTAPAVVNLPPGWAATVSKSLDNKDLILNVTAMPAGPLAAFTIAGIPAQVPLNTAVTGISVTAKDAANQTVTSFNGSVTFSGTAGITGTSGNFTNGVLTGVSITPASPGSSLTFVVTSGTGETGTAIFDVLTMYQGWAAANNLNGPNADPGADPDGDEIDNIQEFAFGMNPNVGGGGAISFDGNQVLAAGTPVAWMHSITANSVDFRAVFARRKDYQVAGLVYTTQFSSDLGEWVTRNTTPTVMANQGNTDIDAVYVPYPLMIRTSRGFEKPKFFRVGVSFAQ